MEPNFVSGDKVQLLRGGPKMKIRGYHYDVLVDQYNHNVFDCIWFTKNEVGKKEIHYCPYNASELTKITNP